MKHISKYFYIIMGLIFFEIATLKAQNCEIPAEMTERQAYSVYYSSYKNGDYEDALYFGKWIIECNPTKIKDYGKFSLSRQYKRFINIYVKQAEKEQDPTQRIVLLEKAAHLYKVGVDYFIPSDYDRYEWFLLEANFYSQHVNQLPDAGSKIIALYNTMFELDFDRAAKEADGYYSYVIAENLSNNASRQETEAFINRVLPLANEDYKEKLKEIQAGFISTPEEKITLLEERITSIKDDKEALLSTYKELLELYRDIEDYEKTRATAQLLYDIDPSTEHAAQLAKLFLQNANTQEALKYYTIAYTNADKENKYIYADDLAKMYLSIDQLQEARKYAQESIKIKNLGTSYMIIASIYNRAVAMCTSDRKFERNDKVVYWLIIDYLDEASKLSPDLKSQIEKEKKQYITYVPTSEDIFFEGWREGDNIAVDGSLAPCYAWIDEKTTIRKTIP